MAPRVRIKGELFNSTLSYGLSTLLRLGSTVIVTRLLAPDAYGVIGLLLSIAFTLELLSDVGMTALLVRHPRGGEQRFVHTIWTVRVARAIGNFALLYALAPELAHFFNAPYLVSDLRLFSFWFLLAGFESPAIVLAVRNQRSIVCNYVELAASAASTVFVIAVAPLVRDHTVLIYGVLLQRMLNTALSHFFYREIGAGIAFDKEALKSQLDFAKVVLPSSLLTIALSQYDKVTLLKLVDLTSVGTYGLAATMIGAVTGLIGRNCRNILYPRCAEYFRSSRETAKRRYYSENARLFTVLIILPAVVAGFAHTIVALLYDLRYQGVGIILMSFGLTALVNALQSASENLVCASGRISIVLRANVARLVTLAPLTILGFYCFGFRGFIWAAFISSVLVLGYCYAVQRDAGLLDFRAEARRLGLGLTIFGLSSAVSFELVDRIPPDLLRNLLRMA